MTQGHYFTSSDSEIVHFPTYCVESDWWNKPVVNLIRLFEP